MSEPDTAVVEAASEGIASEITHAEVELTQNDAIETTAEVAIEAGEVAIEAEQTAEVAAAVGVAALGEAVDAQERVTETQEAVVEVAEVQQDVAYATMAGFQELAGRMDAFEQYMKAREEAKQEPEEVIQPQGEVHEIQVSDGGSKSDERTDERPQRHKFGRR